MNYVASIKLSVCAKSKWSPFLPFQCLFVIAALCVCVYIIISGIHYVIVMLFSKWIVRIDGTHWIGECERCSLPYSIYCRTMYVCVCVNHLVGASNSITQLHCCARWKALMQIFTQLHHILHPHKAFIFSVCLHFFLLLSSITLKCETEKETILINIANCSGSTNDSRNIGRIAFDMLANEMKRNASILI